MLWLCSCGGVVRCPVEWRETPIAPLEMGGSERLSAVCQLRLFECRTAGLHCERAISLTKRFHPSSVGREDSTTHPDSDSDAPTGRKAAQLHTTDQSYASTICLYSLIPSSSPRF